jgi:hypothetical protein
MENYVTIAREAYERLADNITATADQPAQASRLANNSIQYGHPAGAVAGCGCAHQPRLGCRQTRPGPALAGRSRATIITGA